jgi:NTE family protein
MSKDDKNRLQRALVLQGGGSLGAYEAGVFEVLYYWIKKDIDNDNENVFDIVAGTSIGAINKCYYKKRNSILLARYL